MTEELTTDLRKHPRLDRRVRVEVAGSMVTAQTRDLSEGGMFVEWEDPLPTGSLLPVTLHLPTGPLEMTAVVVRALDNVGMGLRFDSQSQVALKRLAAFLDLQDAEG